MAELGRSERPERQSDYPYVSTGADDSSGLDDASTPSGLVRPELHASAASQETILKAQETFRSTPPIDIPVASEHPTIGDEPPQDSFMEQYMRTRQPSVSFNDEVKLDSGLKQPLEVPLQKPSKDWSRGRSLAQVLGEANYKVNRSHSESEREQYDPITGRHLPKYSSSPAREQAKIGEGRFPILQATVDAMAREYSDGLPQNMSLTSDSTMSPVDEPRTPKDEQAIISPSSSQSPLTQQASFSLEERKPFRRTASQRWRDGEGQDSAQDFFSRAGSLSKGRTFSSGRLSRQSDSKDIASTRSPRSVASSYLRAFSMSSSTSGDETNGGPPAVDAEGQTIGEDYVLGKQIGWGGFSVIKEVTQIHPVTHEQRKLAVKIVRRHIDAKSEAENDQVQAEFEHEVELWRFLDNRHILSLEAVYKLEEATFCFIPLNTGGTLFDVVRANRQGVPPVLAQSYAFQLASALRYLHLDARVVHRDIKLENCLIELDPNDPDSPGLVRVCDFGMAEWLSRDESFGSNPPSPNITAMDRPPQKQIGPADTSTSAFAGGSLEYAAPEILRIAAASKSTSGDSEPLGASCAERAIVSPAVDLWAYGVCLYSLIVGSRPFQNTFRPRVVMAILAGDWDHNKVHEKGGEDIHEVVQGCLEMEEADRWSIEKVLASSWLDGYMDKQTNVEVDEEPSAWKL
jgi:serine/threonine protein kinase